MTSIAYIFFGGVGVLVVVVTTIGLLRFFDDEFKRIMRSWNDDNFC